MIKRTTQYDYLNYDGLEHYHRKLWEKLNLKFELIDEAINNSKCDCNSQYGTTNQRPIKDLYIGLKYFDTDLNIPIYWNGNYWVDSSGNPADLLHKGTTEERPNNINFGFTYYNTDLDIMLIFNGERWISLCNCEPEIYIPHWDHVSSQGIITLTDINTLSWYNTDTQKSTEIDNYNWINYY